VAVRCREDRRLRHQIDLQDAFRIGGIALCACGDRGAENNGVEAGGDDTVDQRAVEHIADDHRKPIAIVSESALRRRWQARAVEQGHRMAALQQGFRDIQPDKAGAAKNENLHRSTYEPRGGPLPQCPKWQSSSINL
jgi:hypothetical protein